MYPWLERLEDGLFQKSRSLGPPWGAPLRFLRYPVALIRDWLLGDISIRAMSLAYTTLLSLVPLLVFSFSILKGLGAHGDLRFIVHEFFRPVGGAAPQLTDSVMQFVANMRGGLLGTLGLAFLLYTVITTVQKVEGSFNAVWRVVRPRRFGRRFAEYLAVLLLGPILLAVTIGLFGFAEHSPLATWVQGIAPLAWVLALVGEVVPYLIVTGVFTFMYAFVPNTRVELRAAFIGGVSAGLLWALVGKVFTAVILYSSQLVAIYTGFAIVLTTLIWVYLSWLILLIGAQLAFYLQCPQYLRHGQKPIELTCRDREQVALSIMYLIGRDYAQGQARWNAGRLAGTFDVPPAALAPVLGRLEQAGLLVATEQEEFLPGRDPDSIRLSDIVDAVRTLQSGRLDIAVTRLNEVAPVMDAAEQAMRDRLGSESLKELIAGKDLPAG
jgi:membrane protein